MTKPEVENFEYFLRLVDDMFWNHKPHLRYGQSLMNVLYDIWPEKYSSITGTDLDCFYDDGTVILLIEHLEKTWNKTPV